MVGIAVGLTAVAIAAEVGDDDSEILGELGGDLVPHDVGLGVAVEEEQGWAAATDH